MLYTNDNVMYLNRSMLVLIMQTSIVRSAFNIVSHHSITAMRCDALHVMLTCVSYMLTQMPQHYTISRTANADPYIGSVNCA